MRSFLRLFLVGVCLLAGGIGEARGDTAGMRGQLVIYLSGGSPLPPEISFQIKEMMVIHEKEGEIQIPCTDQEISSLYTAASQVKLSETTIPVGRYISIRWVLDHARVVKGSRFTSLAVAQKEGGVVFPVEFEIRKKESLCLFFDWASKESLEKGYAFHPKVNVGQHKMELSRVLLFVSNSDSDNVSVVDRYANRVVGCVRVGKQPMGVLADDLSGHVYVANAGSNDISVIDTAKYLVLDKIPLHGGIEPTEMVMDSSGRHLYVTNRRSDDVSIIDVRSRTVIRQVKVDNGPTGIAIDDFGRSIYVANSLSNTISIIDATTHRVTNTLRVGSGPRDLLVAGRILLLVNSDTNSLSVMDLGSSSMSGSVTASLLRNITTGQKPFRMGLGKGNTVYLSNQGSGDISVVYPTVNLEIKRLRCGGRPSGVKVDTKLSRLFVADEDQDQLLVVDLTSERIEARIPVGEKPYGIALLR